MLRFLKALILLPVAIVVVLLAVANRGPVTFSLDPFANGVPALALVLPLYAVVFAAVALGIVIGGIAAWSAQGKHRRARRSQGRELSRLRSEAERLRNLPETTSRPALAAPVR
jgi:hypothetical protein